MPGRLICPSLGTAEIIQINNKNSIFAYSSVEKASKMKKPYSQPPACLLYCTKFTGTKNPLSGGFLTFTNGRHTKPIVEKILSIFFEKCKLHVAIFGENYLSCHFSQLRFSIRFFLPALCNQFINNVCISFVPLIIRQVRYQFLDMMPRQCGW